MNKQFNQVELDLVMGSNNIKDGDEDEPFLKLRMYFSVSRSLWRMVKPHLRGVTLGHKGSKIIVNCIFHGEIQEEDLEMMSVAETEVLSDFLHYEVRYTCIRWDYPRNLNEKVLDIWVFRRYEVK